MPPFKHAPDEIRYSMYLCLMKKALKGAFGGKRKNYLSLVNKIFSPSPSFVCYVPQGWPKWGQNIMFLINNKKNRKISCGFSSIVELIHTPVSMI